MSSICEAKQMAVKLLSNTSARWAANSHISAHNTNAIPHLKSGGTTKVRWQATSYASSPRRTGEREKHHSRVLHSCTSRPQPGQVGINCYLPALTLAQTTAAVYCLACHTSGRTQRPSVACTTCSPSAGCWTTCNPSSLARQHPMKSPGKLQQSATSSIVS